MTVDGFGFGTLTGESCLKNAHCHTDRASWDAILVTVVAFGALMWKTCAQSHRFGLGRVGGGGGIPLGGGGRRTENRDHIYHVVRRQGQPLAEAQMGVLSLAVIFVARHDWVVDRSCCTRHTTLNPWPESYTRQPQKSRNPIRSY